MNEILETERIGGVGLHEGWWKDVGLLLDGGTTGEAARLKPRGCWGWNKQSAKIWGCNWWSDHDVTVLGEVRW